MYWYEDKPHIKHIGYHYPPGTTTKRKTWKLFGGGIGTSWAGKSGKYIKRMANKTARLAWKREMRGLHPRRAHVGWQRESNWKGW